MRKNCFGDQEKLLKFEGEDQEFAKCFKLIEKNIQTVKGQYNFSPVHLNFDLESLHLIRHLYKMVNV